MSMVATSLPSSATISEARMIASSETDGDAEYSIFMYERFFLPSENVLPLIMPPLFLFGTPGILAHLPYCSWSIS